jgi:hypothetical protein
MSKETQDSRPKSQPDQEEAAAEQRPVPSQAEGDLETVEEDLREKMGQPKPAAQDS